MPEIGRRRFEGATALVTGAASGIGRAVAGRLGHEGAHVFLADLDRELLGRVLEELATDGASVMGTQVDVVDRQSVRDAVAAAAHRSGRLDIAVNCAGIIRRRPALELSEEDWDAVIDVNLKGTFLVCQAASFAMMERGGSIVNISSIMAEVAGPQRVHYAASKGGVRQLTKAFAVELAPFGIRVNAVGPGPIQTPLNAEQFATEEGRRRMLRGVLRGRAGTPDDVAAAVAFLASAEADFITGTTLYVDGGLLAGH